MGKILLVEPRRILQHALRLFLSREHEIEVRRSIGAAELGAVKGYDLLILDASAASEEESAARIALAPEAAAVPVIWLRGEDEPRPPAREKLAVLTKPLDRKALKTTVDELLAPLKRPAAPAPPATPEQSSFAFIDLVDVVEEAPPGDKRK